MKTLHLHGYLKEKYGESFELDVVTAQEAVRALAFQLPGFESDIKAGNWHVLKGSLDEQDSMDEESVTVGLGHQNEIHLLPAVAGANSGLLSVIVGAVLIVVGVVTANPALVGAGIGMVAGGIISMMMTVPMGDATTQESVDKRPSFLFNGPTNTSSQGLAVPRGYGRCRVGSIVISASVHSEETAV